MSEQPREEEMEEEKGPENIRNAPPLLEHKTRHGYKTRSKGKLINQAQMDNLTKCLCNPLLSTVQSKEILKNLLKDSVHESTESETSSDEEMMTNERKTCLKNKRLQLVKNMIPDELFNYLLSKDILTKNEVDRIKSGGGQESMNEKLIDTIMCKSNRAFSVLVEALKATAQKHLAKLLTSAEKQKQKSGDLRLFLDIEDVKCSCCKENSKQPHGNEVDRQDIENEIFKSMNFLIQQLRQHSISPEQFLKELKCLDICKKFITKEHNKESLLDLRQLYTSGKLLQLFQRYLITMELNQKFHLKTMKLHLRIFDEEFQRSYQELRSLSFDGSKPVCVEDEAPQPSVSAETKTGVLHQNSSPKSRKPLKEMYQKIPVLLRKRRISKRGKGHGASGHTSKPFQTWMSN